MNPLQECLDPVVAVETYKKIREQLTIDGVIFDAMSQVAQRRGFSFSPPASPAENFQKHTEIERLLSQYQHLLARQGIFFDLIEEIYLQLQASGIPVMGEHLLNLASVRVANEFEFRLNTDSTWVIKWQLSKDSNESSEKQGNVALASVYKSNWGPIIPWEVIQYLRSGVLLFWKEAYVTSLALMSIAVEATLRDLLKTRGYTFTRNATRQDVYDYTKAQVDVTGSSYTLNFVDVVPQSPANLLTSSSGNIPVNIKIRRVNNVSKGRVDLVVQCPPFLIDHWSSDTVIQPAVQRNIGGLGEALQIARDVECLVKPSDLPLDVDEVLKALRNNLIHFSSDAMNMELPQFSSYSPTGCFTLKDFISNSRFVFDLVTGIPYFVNEQYTKLFQAGISIF